MSRKKALEGLKVLDFTRVYSGPYCTMLLSDLGAEIIKIEAVDKGDDTRQFYPIKDGESGYFMYLNRGKKSVTLNLKSTEGQSIAMELAKWADIIVENFSPGTIRRLNLSYEDVKKVNPEIIYASISGFGQTGPYKHKAAYDAVAQAMGGMTNLTGTPEGEPIKVGPAISDAATGVHTAVAILAALHSKEKSGEGQYIDVAMMDTVFSMLENFVPIKTLMDIEPNRIGNANPGSAPYNMYKTKDSNIVIATANNSLFMKLIYVMGQPELIEDPRFSTNPLRKENEKEIDVIAEAWTKQHNNQEIEDMLNEVGVPVASVKTIGELVEDDHLKQREMLVEHENPIVGKIIFPGNPLKLQKTPPDASLRAPLLGEHTKEVLESILGYKDDELKNLNINNVI